MRKKLPIVLFILMYPIYGCNVDKYEENNVTTHLMIGQKAFDENIKKMIPTDFTVCSNKNCAPISKEEIENPKLDKPFDVAVSSDGKKVFVINTNKFKNATYCSDNDPKQVIGGQYIYEITEDKKISVVKANGEYLYSCNFNDEIESDFNDNFYFIKKIMKPDSKFFKFTLSSEIYKLTLDNKLTLFKKVDNPLSVPPVSLNMGHLKINETGVYFSLFGKNEGSKEILMSYSKVDDKTQTLLKYQFFNRFEDRDHDFLVIGDKVINDTLISTKIPFGSVNDIDNIKSGEKLCSLSGTNEDISPQVYRTFSILSMELDKSGNIYGISKKGICKITKNNEFIILAGSSKQGYKDGKGEEALFNNPSNLSIDAQGNVYVADTGNNAIRKITPDGMVSTFYKND